MLYYENRSFTAGHTLLSLPSLSRKMSTPWVALLCESNTIHNHSVLTYGPLLFLYPEEKYITIQSYTSQGKDEVSFDKGVTVEVIQKNLEGWWFIRWVCLYAKLEKWKVSRENMSSENSDIVASAVIKALVSCCPHLHNGSEEKLLAYGTLYRSLRHFYVCMSCHLSAHTHCVVYSASVPFQLFDSICPCVHVIKSLWHAEKAIETEDSTLYCIIHTVFCGQNMNIFQQFWLP